MIFLFKTFPRHEHVLSFAFPMHLLAELGIPCHGLARLGITRLALAYFLGRSWHFPLPFLCIPEQSLAFLAMVWHGLALLGLL